jgi:two-component sensor histidine kinase
MSNIEQSPDATDPKVRWSSRAGWNCEASSRATVMFNITSPARFVPFPRKMAHALSDRTIASVENDRVRYARLVDTLRDALAREAVLLGEKETILEQQEILRNEMVHRLLNGLQMVASLLSLQSRASANPDVNRQLSAAAKRVASIERVHRQLHSSDGAETVAFKEYLEELCADFTSVIATDETMQNQIFVEGVEMTLPAATAIPLGFIVNELITNAVKHGMGKIVVELQTNPADGHILSVSNEGLPLPSEYDPAASKGSGMKIIGSFVRQIGGSFRFDCGDLDRGPRFMVLFA